MPILPIHVKAPVAPKLLPSARHVNLPSSIATAEEPQETDELLDAQSEDDVVGNGMFDDMPTVHLGNGMFEDKWSMPGYAARETGLGPTEVVDRNDNPIGVVTDRLFMWPGNDEDAPPPLLEPIVLPNAAQGVEMLASHAPARRGIWNNDRIPPTAISGLDGGGYDWANLAMWAAIGLAVGAGVAFVAKKQGWF